MANSDNVLRGGLTPKHVDVPELLRVLDFTPATEDDAAPADHPRTASELVYDTPAPEFAVSRAGARRRPARPRGRRAVAPRRPADPAVHRGFGGGARQVRRGDAGTGRGGLGGGRRRPDPAGRPASRPSCSVPPSGSRGGTRDVDRGQHQGDPGGAAGQRGHRGREVRRLPDHRQLVDAGRGGALGRRHQQPGSAAVRAARRRARRPTRCTRSATAAAGTSTRSWWRWCCSRSVRSSRSTRATTRSRTRSPDLARRGRS